jgi:PhnB protein
MPQLDAYLHFNGNCAEAMRFYEKTLGGKIDAMSTFADSPMAAQLPPGFGERILHARLRVDGHTLMASDMPPNMPFDGMKGFSLSLNYKTPEQARAVFDALSQGGQVHMPLQATFWAAAFGMFTDRFGVPWMVGCEKAQG